MTPVGSCRSYFVYREYKTIFYLITNFITSCICDNIPSTTTFSDFEPAANKCSIVFNYKINIIVELFHQISFYLIFLSFI